MLFDTPIYLAFLLLIVAVYWRLGFRQQNYFLLAASYFFYGWWDWRFLSLIAISTVVDYFCALAISRSSNSAKRRLLLSFSVVLNLGFLGFFKYFNFFAQSAHMMFAGFGIDIPKPVLEILLPPGISFYTFQALAYIVDVYFRKMEPSENFVDYALFISLFPHLIAGPIQRPSHLLPQTQSPRVFDSEKFFAGLQLICYGMFRKCVVADGCGLIANAAFEGRLGGHNLPAMLIGAYAFAWQIYGDFSGYSDIARGSAQLIGFHFMVNFRQPYLSRSLQEFWRRWHISLSTWLRDYLYISLGGSRAGEVRTYSNLMWTMVIGGFWHGANFTYIVWGFIHGIGLAAERSLVKFHLLKDRKHPELERDTLSDPRAWVSRIVLFHVVCVAWIFFRATSVTEAFRFLGGATTWQWLPEHRAAFVYLAFLAIPLFALDLLLEKRDEEYPFEKATWEIRVAGAVSASILVLMFTANQSNAFIYFQF
ncbi:MAG: MBOAT family protein [Acidobacteriia bacterium]|nr:MBOAT family protein [Terriglobia bacterium]